MALEDIVKGKSWWGSSSPGTTSMLDRASMASLLGAAPGSGSPTSTLPGGLSLSYMHGNPSVVNRSPGGSSKTGNIGNSSTLGNGGAAASNAVPVTSSSRDEGASADGSFGFYTGLNRDAVGTSAPAAGASMQSASTSMNPTHNQTVEKTKDALPQDQSFALVMQHNRWQTWQAKLSSLYSAIRMEMVDGILQASQHPF